MLIENEWLTLRRSIQTLKSTFETGDDNDGITFKDDKDGEDGEDGEIEDDDDDEGVWRI